MDGLALRLGDCQARNRDRSAPQGLSPLLDLQKQTRSSWETGDSLGTSGSDQEDELSEPRVGRSVGINRRGAVNERVTQKGVANHPDPEPCECSREAALEALDRGI